MTKWCKIRMSLISKIKQINYYPALFEKAYNSEVIDLKGVENALAAFCVAILPNNSKFDQGVLTSSNFMSQDFEFDLGNSSTSLSSLNIVENKGMNLFFGKARCSTCHHPQQSGSTYGGFTPTTSFANIGLDLEYTDNGLGSLHRMQLTVNLKFRILKMWP